MQFKLHNINSKRMEIERKFLVKSSAWLAGHKGIAYKQGYLSAEASRTARVRLEGQKGKLTIKGKKKGIAGVNLSITYQKVMLNFYLNIFAENPSYKKSVTKLSSVEISGRWTFSMAITKG